MSIMVGTGHGAKNGVLIKKAEALETFETVNVIVVDKTGTLTEGKPAVQSIVATGDFVNGQIIVYAASVERGSEHPLAGSFLEQAKKLHLSLLTAQNVESKTGRGIGGTVDGKEIYIGNGVGLKISEQLNRTAIMLRDEGQTVMFISIDGKPAGLIGVADAIKPSAKAAIDNLHRQNIQVVMMTGDNRATAEAVRETSRDRPGVCPGDARRQSGQSQRNANARQGRRDGGRWR